MGKRTDYAALKQGLGLARGLSDEFVQVCEARDVPIEAIHRLVRPEGRATMEAVAERILADWQKEQPKPVNDKPTFTAHIVYTRPSFEELKRQFLCYVNDDFRDRRLDPIECCKAISKESREVTFEYVYMGHDASTDEVLAEMDRKGLRPALYEELLGFD
ncbi:MAG: hypothetical protein ABIO72_03940 [Patescibacteria group bacterium]